MQSIMTLTMNPVVETYTTANQVVSGRNLHCEAPRRAAGGRGIRVARTIWKLGGYALAVYPAGGPTGLLLAELLKTEGIPQHPLSIDGMTRENLWIMESSTQRTYRFIMPGPTLNEPEWQRCLDYFADAANPTAYLVASGCLPPGVPADFFACLARIARNNKTRLVLYGGGEPLRLGLEEDVYLLKPNIHELCELAGKDLPDASHQAEAALHLVQSGRAEIVVVSLPDGGAVVASAEGAKIMRAPALGTRSRLGTGDSMLGGIVLGLARDETLDVAVRLGIAAGAAATLHEDPVASSPEDTDSVECVEQPTRK